MDAPRFLTLGEAAVHFGISYFPLYRLVIRKKIPAQKVGRQHAIAVADLDAVRAACVAAGLLTAKPEAMANA